MKRILFTIALIIASAAVFAQVEPLTFTDEVRVYPNPAVEYVNIRIEHTDLSEAQVSIHSIIGNKMQLDIENISAGHYRARIMDLPPGYYLVVVKDQEKKFNRTYKFLKK